MYLEQEVPLVEGLLHSLRFCGSGVSLEGSWGLLKEVGRDAMGGMIHVGDNDEEYRFFLEDMICDI